MNFNEAFGRGDDCFDNAIEVLGLDEIIEMIPFTKKEIIKAILTGDEHLNTLPMKEWNRACGFTYTAKNEQIFTPGRFQNLLATKAGVTVSANSQLVCVLKSAAKQWVAEEMDQLGGLMERFLVCGYPKEDMDHHESDLYVYKTPLTDKIVTVWAKENGYSKDWHCPTFKDQVTGKAMFDCAFQYHTIDPSLEAMICGN